jgi:hypothetical protein
MTIPSLPLPPGKLPVVSGRIGSSVPIGDPRQSCACKVLVNGSYRCSLAKLPGLAPGDLNLAAVIELNV